MGNVEIAGKKKQFDVSNLPSDSRRYTETQAMDGANFSVEYLGSTMLPKATTGLGAVQKPLKELYFSFRKPGGEKNAKEMNLIVQRDGLVFEFIDKFGDQSKRAFYDIGLIHYIAALRFSAMKFSDKKFQAAFMPLEDSKLPSNDKVYFQLDKKHANMVQTNHPALMALLMRRPTGVKSIECHAFVVRNTADAIRLVSMVETIQLHQNESEYSLDAPARDRADRPFSSGPAADVIRTEFGEYEVYRGRKQLELTDDFFRPKGPEQGMLSDRVEPKFNSPDVVQVREPIQSNVNNRSSGEMRNEPWKMPRINQDMLADKQRTSREMEPERQYVQSASDRGAYYSHDMGQRDRQDNRGVYSRGVVNSGSAERFPKPNNQHEQHPRTYDDQRYYAEYDEQRYRSSRDDRSPPKPAQQNKPREALVRPLSPVGGENRIARGPVSPREVKSPRSEMFQEGPVYSASASNLESRNEPPGNERDDTRQKPVAKVPPHLVAGVKVLPTGFALPKKPLNPRDEYIRDNDYDNNLGVMRKMQETNEDFPSKRENDMQGRHEYIHGYEQDDKYGGRSMSESDQLRKPHSQSQDKSNRFSAPNTDTKYLYEQRSSYESAWQPENKSRSNYEMSYDKEPRSAAADDINHNVRKKDQEIASMFSHMRTDESKSHFYTSGTNFEHSLGYFP